MEAKSNKRTPEMKAFLKKLKETNSVEAMVECGVEPEILGTWLRASSSFRKAYYTAINLTEKQVKFLKVFGKKMCNVKQTCEAIGIHRDTYYAWYNSEQSDTFKNEVDAIKEGLKDDAESKLYHKIFVEGDTTSLIWYTKTQMKDRGYVEKMEQDVNMDAKVEHRPYKDLTDEELKERIDKLERIANGERV